MKLKIVNIFLVITSVNTIRIPDLSNDLNNKFIDKSQRSSDKVPSSDISKLFVADLTSLKAVVDIDLYVHLEFSNEKSDG